MTLSHEIGHQQEVRQRNNNRKVFVVSAIVVFLLYGFLFVFPNSTIAVQKSVAWTTKGDFLNNNVLGPDYIPGTSDDNKHESAGTERNSNIVIDGINNSDDASVTLLSTANLFGDAFQVSNSYLSSTSVAYNSSANQFMVVWDHWSLNGSDVYGQLVNADGTPVSTSFLISYSSGEKRNPDIAYSHKSNKYIITWANKRNFSSDIYAQVVEANGSLSGTNFIVSAASTDQLKPIITYSAGANRFLVAWTDESNVIRKIYGKIINADGQLVGTNFIIANEGANPSVVSNSYSGQFVVAFEKVSDIYLQRINSDRTLVGSAILVSDGYNKQYGPSIAYNSTNNQYLVVWSDRRWFPPDAGIGTIFFQRLNSDGTFIGSNAPLSNTLTEISGSNLYPEIAFSSTSKKYIILWNQTETWPNSNIYLQVLNQDTTLGDVRLEVSTINGNALRPSIAYNSLSNQFMTLWYNEGAGTAGILGQRILLSHKSPGVISGFKINVGKYKKVKWNTILWNGLTPTSTTIKFRTRGANKSQDLNSSSWSKYYTVSGQTISAFLSYQWLEIEATLDSLDGLSAPILNDFRLLYEETKLLKLTFAAKQKMINIGKKVLLAGKLKDYSGKAIAGKKITIRAFAIKKIKKKIGKKIKKITKRKLTYIVTVTTNAKGIFSLRHKPRTTTTYRALYKGEGDFSSTSTDFVKVIVKRVKPKK